MIPLPLLLPKAIGLVKGLFTKQSNHNSLIFLAIVFGLIAMLVLPNISVLSEKLFGVETRETLTGRLHDQRHNTEMALQVNKNLLDQIELKEQAEQDKDKVDTQLEQQKQEKMEQIDYVIVTKKKQINEINKMTPQVTASKVRAISQTQISALWNNYCKNNSSKKCDGRITT